MNAANDIPSPNSRQDALGRSYRHAVMLNRMMGGSVFAVSVAIAGPAAMRWAGHSNIIDGGLAFFFGVWAIAAPVCTRMANNVQYRKYKRAARLSGFEPVPPVQCIMNRIGRPPLPANER